MASTLARGIVAKFGLGDRLQVHDDAAISMSRQVSSEVEDILSAALDEARAMLRSKAVEHSALVEALLRHHYLDAPEVREILINSAIGHSKILQQLDDTQTNHGAANDT